mmetsp:Transcript_37573/g.70047  ORF Transcript_37573/g.70047 Transcript_37573/m.70047 type:complete len:239 (+) Transcript_37573:82-798(+)
MDPEAVEHREKTRDLLKERSNSVRHGIVAEMRSNMTDMRTAKSSKSVQSTKSPKSAVVLGSSISKDAVEKAWTYAGGFRKRSLPVGSEAEENMQLPIKTFLGALRSIDPNITFRELEWVLGKEDTNNDTKVSLDDLLETLSTEDDAEFDPLEHSFHYFCDASGHLDLAKVRDVLSFAGEVGVTETIVSFAMKRMMDEQGDERRKKGPIEFRDYRKLFSLSYSGSSSVQPAPTTASTQA